MMSCNVKRLFVPNDLPQNRLRILKPASQLEQLDPQSDDAYMSGIVQRYAARPIQLNSINLADFSVEYDVCYGRQRCTTASQDDIQPTEEAPVYDNIIKLQNGMGVMRHRKVRAILLYTSFLHAKRISKILPL